MRYKVSENFFRGSKFCFVGPLGQTVNVGGDSNERNYTGWKSGNFSNNTKCSAYHNQIKGEHLQSKLN